MHLGWEAVINVYESRANSEKWIKELKGELSPDTLSPESFAAMMNPSLLFLV